MKDNNGTFYRVVRLSRLPKYAKHGATCCVCGCSVSNRDVMSAYYDGSSFLMDVEGTPMSARYFVIKCLSCIDKDPVNPVLVVDDRAK